MGAFPFSALNSTIRTTLAILRRMDTAECGAWSAAMLIWLLLAALFGAASVLGLAYIGDRPKPISWSLE